MRGVCVSSDIFNKYGYCICHSIYIHVVASPAATTITISIVIPVSSSYPILFPPALLRKSPFSCTLGLVWCGVVCVHVRVRVLLGCDSSRQNYYSGKRVSLHPSCVPGRRNNGHVDCRTGKEWCPCESWKLIKGNQIGAKVK